MARKPSDSSREQATEERIDDELSRLITQLTNEITWQLSERGLSRADLAGRLGVSPGRVSQILSGGENLTLRTLANLAAALDAHFELELTAPAPSTGEADAQRADVGVAARKFRPSRRALRLHSASGSSPRR
jgi:transcriptional regulator with XRE-family HTH domain